MKKSSCYKGVCWDSVHKKWIARIVVNGVTMHLGYFDNEEKAFLTWRDYRDKYRPRQVVIDLCGEEWKPIQKFGDNYFVSNKGRVKNIDFKRTGDEKLLRPSEDTHGYYEVKKGRIHGKIHRLVLEAFVGSSDLYVNHKDFNPKNNCLENLEYVTQRENMTHSIMAKRGYMGCCWDCYYNKWSVYIKVNGKSCFVGRYNTKENAVASYIKKSQELGIINKYLNVGV